MARARQWLQGIDLSSSRRLAGLAAVFIVLAAGLIAGQYRAFENRREESYRLVREQLVAVRDLKLSQIADWRTQRLKDARYVRGSLFAQTATRILAEGGDPGESEGVRSRARDMVSFMGCERISLFDASGTPVYSLPAIRVPLDTRLMSAVMDSGEPAAAEMRLDELTGQPRLDIYVPLLPQLSADQRPTALLVMTRDPNADLFPLVQTWPGPSPSAETLLVRPADDEILYLNSLRHRKDSALKLRLPLDEPGLPAAAALSRETGTMEGVDYRGVPVFAAVGPVPDSTWAVVAKIDASEVEEPIRMARLQSMEVAALEVLAAALVVGLLWRQESLAAARRVLAAESELAEYRAHLEELVSERTAALERTNAELARVIDELRAATAAKSDFLANMSHELRTPLNSIIGFTGVILQGLAGELTDEQRYQLGLVQRSGIRLLGLVNDVLDLTRIESGTVELQYSGFDAAEFVRASVETLRPLAREKGLALTCTTEQPVPVRSDRDKLQQIVLNLVSNAVKFTEAGSVTVEVAAEGQSFSVSVADTGPGLTAEDIGLVFDRFTQVRTHDAKPEGTGLGLAISKQMAQLLGGDVTVTSQVGVGSTFTLSLPIQPPGESEPDVTSGG